MSVLPRRADESHLTLRTAAPMFAAGPDLEIVLWNDGAERMLGFARGDVLGRRCHDVLDCPRHARRLCSLACGERAGIAAVPGFDVEVSTAGAARQWVSVTTVLASTGGEAPLRVHLLRELGRQRQLEELLRQVVSTAAKLSGRAAADPGEAPAPARRGVTGREREVFRLLAQGSSTAEIAARLGITPRTARNHIQNILGKLRVHSRLEAVVAASARGLL